MSLVLLKPTTPSHSHRLVALFALRAATELQTALSGAIPLSLPGSKLQVNSWLWLKIRVPNDPQK